MIAETRLTRGNAAKAEPQPWGRLVWMVSGAIGNSETMTVGRCYIDEGSANPRHFHPNCDEVLHVLSGSIEHSLGDEMVAMEAGDTISIPQGAMHHARNVGTGEAVFVITFSSPDRQVVGE
jgi:quercetin dioxygenase-like cupin family protein